MILAARDLPFEVVEVKEWGGAVHVSTMSGAERERFLDSIKGSEQTPTEFASRMLSAVVVGEDGERLFTVEDMAALGEKNPEVVGRVLEVAMRINGYGPKAVEEAAKN
jgi:hypothetical protein